MPPVEGVETIAGKLTADQCARVMALPVNENRMGGFGRDSGCQDLIEAVGINHPIFGSHYRLTPLGIQVQRTLLQRNSNNGN